ncbi:unnamed protein product [Ceratitis capitata]|uniref:(Mediterranean fruit fly) hypothetical protein n=1 Tax=Ceratitis capitata TaxID=7213 RepID=A0A811UNT8_CERCA|nr:unnamed protein product [Ceratitis capitata]
MQAHKSIAAKQQRIAIASCNGFLSTGSGLPPLQRTATAHAATVTALSLNVRLWMSAMMKQCRATETANSAASTTPPRQANNAQPKSATNSSPRRSCWSAIHVHSLDSAAFAAFALLIFDPISFIAFILHFHLLNSKILHRVLFTACTSAPLVSFALQHFSVASLHHFARILLEKLLPYALLFFNAFALLLD